MSLRRPAALTFAKQQANRRNAQQSTGPRTPSGKSRARGNALRHGRYAAPGASADALRALGEDPAEFERLRQELLAAYDPQDALWAQQVDDLARLYWRRARLERARAGLLRRDYLEQQNLEEQLRREARRAAFPPAADDGLRIVLPVCEDQRSYWQQMLSFLEALRQQILQRTWKPEILPMLERMYAKHWSYPAGRLHGLLFHIAQRLPGQPPPGEDEYRRLQEAAEAEIAFAREEVARAQREGEAMAAAMRDACLAPIGPEWSVLARQENALDRAIDRKVRILLRLRRDYAAATRRGPTGVVLAGEDAREDTSAALEADD